MKKLLIVLLCLSFTLPLTGQAELGPMYEIFVASFADGDGDRRGDLAGLTQKLDYIEALGIKSIWLMPIHPSPTYHKYDVTDYKAIDPAYGSLEQFDALVTAANDKGIAIILDLVINHSSNQHPWFLQAVEDVKSKNNSVYVDYYLLNQISGHPLPGVANWFYQGYFGPHMPELNLDNHYLREEIKSILTFWLDRGVRGFRLDATTHYYEDNTAKNSAFLSWLNLEAKKIRADAFIIAEAWKDESTILSLYESGIDSLFNFPLSGATGSLVSALRNKQGAELSRRVTRWQEQIRAKNPLAIDAPFLSNHDMGRSAGYFLYKDRAMKQAAALYLTLPGLPVIYYGEEIGMSGSGRDENKRLPMLWSVDERLNVLPPADADQSQRLKASVLMQEDDPDSLLSFYKNMLCLRGLFPEFESGSAVSADMGMDSIAAWKISRFDKSFFVIHNLSGESIRLERPNTQLLGSWDTGSGVAFIVDKGVILPPYTGCIVR